MAHNFDSQADDLFDKQLCKFWKRDKTANDAPIRRATDREGDASHPIKGPPGTPRTPQK